MDLLADAKKMDAIAAQASDLRPCIVFIDEADDVFKNRRFSSNAALTNKMLAIMDGSAGQVPDVLFVAATNHIEDMDPAALRGGRLTEKGRVRFARPDDRSGFRPKMDENDQVPPWRLISRPTSWRLSWKGSRSRTSTIFSKWRSTALFRGRTACFQV